MASEDGGGVAQLRRAAEHARLLREGIRRLEGTGAYRLLSLTPHEGAYAFDPLRVTLLVHGLGDEQQLSPRATRSPTPTLRGMLLARDQGHARIACLSRHARLALPCYLHAWQWCWTAAAAPSLT